MDGGLWQYTGDRDQDHLPEIEIQKRKMIILGGLKNSREKKEKQKAKETGDISIWMQSCKE